MRIEIVGGGPAGLYFALLMKQIDPSHEITVYERNAPDDTFGWGVVFSDKTLSYLADADGPTHDEILEAFATWTDVVVVHQGQTIRIGGNDFSGISRIELLKILQRRCEALGVKMQFQTEISDIESLRSADLLVGADGVKSVVRETDAALFGASVDARPNHYIWYGTEQVFDGLTLTFRTNEAGLFMAHSYKFDDTTSTFIVECDPETWRAAGFEQMSEEATRDYLQAVFADDLGGHPLLTNRSIWFHFNLVTNSAWSHDNVVLLGDSQHTAHFSIGSGTKLALESAIALADCFRERGDDVPAALARFDEVRRPRVDRLQAAAFDSMVWFEKAREYVHLAPYPFTYAVMTRSGRIDDSNLRARDPEFVAAYERAVAE